MKKNNLTSIDALVESVRKGGSLKRILEDEMDGDGSGMLDKDKAKKIVEMLEDAQNIMDAAYGELESAMSPVAMEDETVKQTMESLGKMTEDIDTVKNGVASMAGMTEADMDDDDGEEMDEDETDVNVGQDPAELDTPSTHTFTVKGVTDDQGYMNDLADLCGKYNATMTVDESDTIIHQTNDPEREGEQPDDKTVSKELAAHMDLEGKMRKFRVTEGVKAAIMGREILPKNKRRRAFESAKRKKSSRKFGKK